MIRGRTATVLTVLALVTGSLLWGLIRFEIGDAAPHAMRLQPLLDWPADTVNLLLVERPGLRVECRQTDDRWWMTSPIRVRADAVRIRRLLDQLETVSIVDTISRADIEQRKLSLDDFALESPRFRLVLGSPTRRLELLVGGRLPLEDRVYVSLPPSPDVYVVDADAFAAVPDTVAALRDTRLLDGDPRNIAQIELRRTGTPFIQLVRDTRQWRLTQPLDARADPDAIQTLLDGLYNARVRRFLWPRDDDSASGDMLLRERLMVYGLDRDENVLQLHLREAGQALGAQLRIGLQRQTEDGTVYVHWSGDGTIAAVDADILRWGNLSPNVLRDKRVLRLLPDEVRRMQFSYAADTITLERPGPFERWNLSAPVADVADPHTVNSFLHALIGLRAEGFVDNPILLTGATNPVSRLELSGPGLRQQLDVWPLPDQAHWLVRPDGRDFGYLVAADRLPEALKLPAGAPAFRDKTVLALATESLRRLTRHTAAGETLKIERHPDGSWKADLPLPAILDPVAFDNLLFTLAHLRAERVAALSARDPEPYGLRPPAIEWMVELAGDDGLSITLRIGEGQAEGGHYAMVRGRDVVFVLSPETVEVLSRPMILRPEP